MSSEQERFIIDLVKSGRAANKAHAIRMGITLLAQEESMRRSMKAERELADGKGLKGDLRVLAKRVV
jgi:Arc/MetJ-type ribon-helix-helix transcriptional regulator